MQKTMLVGLLFICLSVSGQNQKTYSIDLQRSLITWKGSYSFLMTSYEGTVQFISGELYTNNNNVSGGNFEIDMTSIDGGGPVEHLRDTDFFDVQAFPRAYLKITKVQYLEKENVHIFDADLTIKGITKSIVFNARIDGFEKTFTSKLKIDRTRWGITYNNRVKNKAISDAIEFDVVLVFQ